MNARDYRFLLGERAALQRLIDDTDADEVIVRASFQYRLEEVEAEIAAYGERSASIVGARLTFGGGPVLGNRGVNVDFLAESAGEFAKAVHYIGAGQRQTPLSASGSVPYSDDYRLLITGVARGSFGIRVEAASTQIALPGDSTDVELAIGEFKDILEASVSDDEQLANVIGEIDPRALGQVRAFLKTVADNGAVCTLEFRGYEFGFRDTAQVRRSENRLSDDNIREDHVTIEAEFMGYFPHRPRAQLRIRQASADFLDSEIRRVVTARVAPALANEVDLYSFLKQVVSMDVIARRVGGGRPRYVVVGVSGGKSDIQ